MSSKQKITFQKKGAMVGPKSEPSPFTDAPAPSLKAASDRRIIFTAGVLIILATLAAYLNSFSVPFINDDYGSIADNATIRHLWPIWDALSPPYAGGETVGGRPVLNLSFAVNYAISGKAVWSYHALNFIIHVLAGLILYGIMRRTLLLPVLRERFSSAALPLALAVALLWVVHPLQTEAVTYIVQRSESLMGLFFLLTLYCFVRAVESRKPGTWLALSTVACLLGMASKEVMVSAPLVVLLYDRTFVAGTFRKAFWQHWRYYSGLAATWLVLAHLVAGVGSRGGSAGFVAGVSWWAYALTEFQAITHYLWLSVWPQNLTFIYPRTLAKPGIEIVPYALLVASLVMGTLIALRRSPRMGFLGAWFFLILAPTSSVVPVATETMAERRMYLALAPLVVFAVLGLYCLVGKRSVIVFLVLTMGLTWLTFHRNENYRSELAIWSDTVAKSPNDPITRNCLGNVLLQNGQINEAIIQFQTALAIRPDYAEAHNNLGKALFQKGQFDESIIQFQKALAITPEYAEVHYNLGSAFYQKGFVDEAITQYQEALALQPDYAPVHNNLGNALFQKGRVDEAIIQFQKALADNPDFADAHNNLGAALIQQGRLDEAIAELQTAVAIQPGHAGARNNLGAAFMQAGRMAEALGEYWKVLETQPENVDALNNLAWALATGPQATLRDGVSAVALAQKAVRLSDGGNPRMLRTLAAAEAEAGRFVGAAETARQALQLAAVQKNDPLAATLQKELELYQMNTPMREGKP
jgi:tetratricopeptide (TPR) repeat protein